LNPTRVNYQTMMESLIEELQAEGLVGEKSPRLLLHSCCGPCSTAVITALSPFFRITVFYYNPNIDDSDEYEKRKGEQIRLLSLIPTVLPVDFIEGEYLPEDFSAVARPLADEPEGGRRCTACFLLRLERTAEKARELGIDWLCTTLSVSPHKDAVRLNEIGGRLADGMGLRWLWSDFKKKDGYRVSTELSKKYGLYRQEYCGCAFSKSAADTRSRE